jgi:hypothetical protein
MSTPTPCGKRTYPSPQAAHNALDDIIRRTRHAKRRRRPTTRRGDRVYKCGPCNGWHITRGEWGALHDMEADR